MDYEWKPFDDLVSLEEFAKAIHAEDDSVTLRVLDEGGFQVFLAEGKPRQGADGRIVQRVSQGTRGDIRTDGWNDEIWILSDKGATFLLKEQVDELRGREPFLFAPPVDDKPTGQTTNETTETDQPGEWISGRELETILGTSPQGLCDFSATNRLGHYTTDFLTEGLIYHAPNMDPLTPGNCYWVSFHVAELRRLAKTVPELAAWFERQPFDQTPADTADLRRQLAEAQERIQSLETQLAEARRLAQTAETPDCEACKAENLASEWAEDVRVAVVFAVERARAGGRVCTEGDRGDWQAKRGKTRKRAFEAFRLGLPPDLKDGK